MENQEIAKEFIELYYVKGASYSIIQEVLKAKDIAFVRKLYSDTKESTLVDSIKKLKSQYSGLKQRSLKNKEEVGWNAFSDFYDWFKHQGDVCFYCKSTLEEVTSYLDSEKKKSKHAHKRKKRGYAFEIDRKNHDSKYNSDDCVLSCYLCNNAKSDLIEAKEFMPIGKALGLVIRKK